MSKSLNVYTHAGRFHADEVLAFTILKMSHPNAVVRRLVDITDIPDDGIVIDIGREYNAEKLRFDHHQEFITRSNGYPLASAGLIWRHFGMHVLQHNFNLPSDSIPFVSKYVDENFIQGIDANDTDNQYHVSAHCSAGEVQVMTLPGIIRSMNHQDVNDHEQQGRLFEMAAKFITSILMHRIGAGMAVFNARMSINKANTLFKGKVIVLRENIAWGRIIDEVFPDAVYVIEPSSHPGSLYSMTAVQKDPKSREVKIPIERPEGYEGFIHQGKWIAGANDPYVLISLAKHNINRHYGE